MKIAEIVQFLEEVAPLSYQESYDNAGLILGQKNWDCTGAILCLDSLEEVVDEAIAKGCNLIIAHHPIVFFGLKKINGKNYIERILIKAIKADIAIYASHTNLDSVLRQGVNTKIAEKLGLQNLRILSPKKGLLLKLQTYVPSQNLEAVREALFAAGAGQIGNYSECSFEQKGQGSFKGNAQSQPHLGQKEQRHYEAEHKLEVILPKQIQHKVLAALNKAHPYEEVAYELIALENAHQEVGIGVVGELPEAQNSLSFLKSLKQKMATDCVKYTDIHQSKVQRIAICGGAGSFLLGAAKGAGADVFITADYKYHEFFDADGQLIIADLGHYESEQFTIELFYELISQKFPNFTVHKTTVRTNPVNYL